MIDREYERSVELAFPDIDWREPEQMRLLGAGELTTHYACRYCIAMMGFLGSPIHSLPTDPAAVRWHIQETHL